MAAVTNYKGDPFDLLEHQSGLINYLFGKTRKKQINKDNFMKFQQDLMNDILFCSNILCFINHNDILFLSKNQEIS